MLTKEAVWSTIVEIVAAILIIMGVLTVIKISM